MPKTFAAAVRGAEQSVAELGFIVVMIDGRGTTGRSRAFHEFSYHNLGGSFEDHVAMIRQVAEKFPYMESAVGVGGHQTPYPPALEKIVPASEGIGGKRNTLDEIIMGERVEEN